MMRPASRQNNRLPSSIGWPRRWPAEPGLPGVVRMLDPYTYRCPAGHPDPCPVCTGAPHLEEILEYEGANTVAAVILGVLASGLLGVKVGLSQTDQFRVDAESVDEPREGFRVRLGGVGEVARAVGEAEAQQVRRDAAVRGGEPAHQVPPLERPRGRAVDEDDGLARAEFSRVESRRAQR